MRKCFGLGPRSLSHPLPKERLRQAGLGMLPARCSLLCEGLEPLLAILQAPCSMEKVAFKGQALCHGEHQESRSQITAIFSVTNWSVPTTPDPNTSAKASRYKRDPYRDTNWWRVFTTFCQPEGILLPKYRDRNGRCIAILFKSIGVRGRFDSPELSNNPPLPAKPQRGHFLPRIKKSQQEL